MTSQNILSREALTEAINACFQPSFVFFWSHQPKKAGIAGKECLSQWYPAPFEVDKVRYPTAEHFMMAEKARVFADEENRQKILQSTDPEEVKKLGRQVRNFDTGIWEKHRFDVVVRGNMAKFGQNSELRKFLISTGGKILVEASPFDQIWGVGLGEDDPRIMDPRQWKGLNLIGFALMAVRTSLMED